jgi:hypothetical protein
MHQRQNVGRLRVVDGEQVSFGVGVGNLVDERGREQAPDGRIRSRRDQAAIVVDQGDVGAATVAGDVARGIEAIGAHVGGRWRDGDRRGVHAPGVDGARAGDGVVLHRMRRTLYPQGEQVGVGQRERGADALVQQVLEGVISRPERHPSGTHVVLILDQRRAHRAGEIGLAADRHVQGSDSTRDNVTT